MTNDLQNNRTFTTKCVQTYWEKSIFVLAKYRYNVPTIINDCRALFNKKHNARQQTIKYIGSDMLYCYRHFHLPVHGNIMNRIFYIPHYSYYSNYISITVTKWIIPLNEVIQKLPSGRRQKVPVAKKNLPGILEIMYTLCHLNFEC